MKAFQVNSLAGTVNGFVLNGVNYAPVKDNECDTCAQIGGYCGGGCMGINFSLVVDVEPPSPAPLLNANGSCAFCGYEHGGADC